MESPILQILVLLPLAGALVIALLSRDNEHLVKPAAFVTTLVTLALSLMAAARFDWSASGAMQLVSTIGWVESFGLAFGFGVDSISLWLVLLTTFLMPIVIAGSFTAVTDRVREFFIWLLILEAAMIGTFVATDVIFFYICFEFTLVPLYFLIGIWGSTQRLRAARVFFLYTFTGSMLTFAGVLYVAWFASQPEQLGVWTFNIAELTAAAQQMSDAEQRWVLLALLAGFAVKVPVWPVHTWLPLAHTEAPTAGSVILAGVLLKLGTYGILRLAIPMCPAAVVAFAPTIGVLAVIGILYTGLICWVQKDIKKLIAYSSVSHLGFCVLGLFAIGDEVIGQAGAVMYMINHGLSTGALFLCVGMIYERFHTREMRQYGGMARAMPAWSFFMVFFCLASVGLPGLNGFVGEFLTLMGAFTSRHVLGWPYAAAAGVGMIIGAIYILYMVGKVVFGPVKLPSEHEHGDDHAHGDSSKPLDLNAREIALLTPLAIGCLLLGLQPNIVLDTLDDPETGPLVALVEPAHRVLLAQPAAEEFDEGKFHTDPLDPMPGVRNDQPELRLDTDPTRILETLEAREPYLKLNRATPTASEPSPSEGEGGRVATQGATRPGEGVAVRASIPLADSPRESRGFSPSPGPSLEGGGSESAPSPSEGEGGRVATQGATRPGEGVAIRASIPLADSPRESRGYSPSPGPSLEGGGSE